MCRKRSLRVSYDAIWRFLRAEGLTLRKAYGPPSESPDLARPDLNPIKMIFAKLKIPPPAAIAAEDILVEPVQPNVTAALDDENLQSYTRRAERARNL